MKKITFITAHNWDTKRLGGFHKFAEAMCLRGIETVFFSFPRPYYGLFLKREQLNARVIKTLARGKAYEIANGRRILNVAFPTFRLPDKAGKILPDAFMNFMLLHSTVSFKRFARRFLDGTDCFIFESCEGIFLADSIRWLYPDAKLIYRPSDPLVYAEVPKRVKRMEEKILREADKTLVVNEEGLSAYRAAIPQFDESVAWCLLPNGVDIAPYKKKYPAPDALRGKTTALYVGAWDVEWPLLFKAAAETPEITYIVVCPNFPPKRVIDSLKKNSNLVYVPGINPREVPAWITNCSLVMVPYKTDFYKDRPLGITAKYYQAMAAEKPIVAYSDTPKLKDAGVAATYRYDDFIRAVKIAAAEKARRYDFDLSERTWEKITERFFMEIENAPRKK